MPGLVIRLTPSCVVFLESNHTSLWIYAAERLERGHIRSPEGLQQVLPADAADFKVWAETNTEPRRCAFASKSRVLIADGTAEQQAAFRNMPSILWAWHPDESSPGGDKVKQQVRNLCTLLGVTRFSSVISDPVFHKHRPCQRQGLGTPRVLTDSFKRGAVIFVEKHLKISRSLLQERFAKSKFNDSMHEVECSEIQVVYTMRLPPGASETPVTSSPVPAAVFYDSATGALYLKAVNGALRYDKNWDCVRDELTGCGIAETDLDADFQKANETLNILATVEETSPASASSSQGHGASGPDDLDGSNAPLEPEDSASQGSGGADEEELSDSVAHEEGVDGDAANADGLPGSGSHPSGGAVQTQVPITAPLRRGTAGAMRQPTEATKLPAAAQIAVLELTEECIPGPEGSGDNPPAEEPPPSGQHAIPGGGNAGRKYTSVIHTPVTAHTDRVEFMWQRLDGAKAGQRAPSRFLQLLELSICRANVDLTHPAIQLHRNGTVLVTGLNAGRWYRMTVTDGSSRANATSEALEFVTPYPPPSITSVQRVREQNGPPPAIELCWEEQRFDGTLANGYEIFVSTSRSHLQFERVRSLWDDEGRPPSAFSFLASCSFRTGKTKIFTEEDFRRMSSHGTNADCGEDPDDPGLNHGGEQAEGGDAGPEMGGDDNDRQSFQESVEMLNNGIQTAASEDACRGSPWDTTIPEADGRAVLRAVKPGDHLMAVTTRLPGTNGSRRSVVVTVRRMSLNPGAPRVAFRQYYSRRRDIPYLAWGIEGGVDSAEHGAAGWEELVGCPPLEQDVWIAPAGVVGICSVHLAPPCGPPQGPPDTVPNGPAAHFYCRFTLSRGSTPTQLCVTHALEADEEAQREALSAWRPSAAAARPVVAGEIFAGCGGTSMGLSKAGIPSAWAVECDPEAATTWRINHASGSVMHEGRVEEILCRICCGESGAPAPGGIAILAASSPCQGFSTANSNKRSKSSELNRRLSHIVPEYVQALEPALVMFENVRGMLRHPQELSAVLVGLLREGYQLRFGVVNCADYGIAQTRARLLLLAAKRGVPLPEWPQPDRRAAARPGHRCNLRGGQPVLLNHVAIGWKSRRRPPAVELDSPANTILTLPSTRWRCWHPEQERLLAVREVARLMSFPDSMQLWGSLVGQYRMLGNAVPPLLAQAVGRRLLAALGHAEGEPSEDAA
eukprot:jgi/Tetstr1/440424/TSEL_028758.t2